MKKTLNDKIHLLPKRMKSKKKRRLWRKQFLNDHHDYSQKDWEQ